MPTCFPHWCKETMRVCIYLSQYLWFSSRKSSSLAISLRYWVSFTSSLSLSRFRWAFMKGLICQKTNKPYIVAGKLTKGHATPTFQSGTEAKIPCKWLIVTKFTEVLGTGLSSSIFSLNWTPASSSTGICMATCMLLTFYFLLSSEWLPLTDSFTLPTLYRYELDLSTVESSLLWHYPLSTLVTLLCACLCVPCASAKACSLPPLCASWGLNRHCAGPIMLRLLHINASFLPHFAINISLCHLCIKISFHKRAVMFSQIIRLIYFISSLKKYYKL